MKLIILVRWRIGRQKIKPESELVEQIKMALNGRPLVNPTVVSRPEVLPKEFFLPKAQVSTRKAAKLGLNG